MIVRFYRGMGDPKKDISMSQALGISVLAICVACFGAMASAQPDLPDGSFLEPYTNLWNVTVVVAKDGRRVDAGTWSDEGKFITWKGQPAFRRVQVFSIKRTGGKTTTTNVFDAKTMRPLAREFSTSAGDDTQLLINGTDVEVIDGIGPNRAAPKHTHLTIAQPFYDFSGGTYGLLLAGLPLTDGYSGSLTTIAERDQSLQNIPFKVVAHELVEAKPGTNVMAWKVEAVWHEPDPKTDGSLLTFWLTKSPPYIIKLIYDSRGLGQTYVYTMA
jgi:hypothetical protein